MMQSLVYSVVRTNKATYQLIKDQEVRKKSFYDTTACSSPMEPSSSSPSTLKAAQLLLSAKSSLSSVHPSPWSPTHTHTHKTGLKDKDKEKDNLLECTEPFYPAKGSTSSCRSTFHSNALVVEEHVDDENDEDDNMNSVRVINEPGLAPSEGLVSDLQDAVGHLKVVFESNICLSKSLIAHNSIFTPQILFTANSLNNYMDKVFNHSFLLHMLSLLHIFSSLLFASTRFPYLP